MPSAIEVNIFISLVIFKNKNEFFENLNYFENYVFKILFSFVMVGQNTSRSNVQRFPNPKKLNVPRRRRRRRRKGSTPWPSMRKAKINLLFTLHYRFDMLKCRLASATSIEAQVMTVLMSIFISLHIGLPAMRRR